jgi:hypothetical protein
VFELSVTASSAVPAPTVPSTISPPPAVIDSVSEPSTVSNVTSLPALLPVSVIAPLPAARLTLPAVTPAPAVFTVSVPFKVVVATAL